MKTTPHVVRGAYASGSARVSFRVLVVAIVACARPPVITAESDASSQVSVDQAGRAETTPTATASASATATTAVTASASASASASRMLPLVDATASRSCVVAYGCGMSHPGLGTSMRSTSVDLATCMKSKSSSSGPYENDLPLPGARAPTSTSTSSKVTAADCSRLRDLVTTITAEDARREQESAHIDSEACTLTVSCGAARDDEKISVQRQSPSTGPVGQVIRAL